MSERQLPDPAHGAGDERAGGGSGFAATGLAILAATEVRAVAAALLQGLQDCAFPASAVAWTDHGELLFEPPNADTTAQTEAAVAAFSGQPQVDAGAVETHLLPPGAADAGAVLLARPGRQGALEPAQSRLLALAGRRLSELFSIQRLHASVKDLGHAEKLQHALFAIADMASSDLDMQSLLHGLHQIIGQLMYAEIAPPG